jgi:hypothetical protein
MQVMMGGTNKVVQKKTTAKNFCAAVIDNSRKRQ